MVGPLVNQNYIAIYSLLVGGIFWIIFFFWKITIVGPVFFSSYYIFLNYNWRFTTQTKRFKEELSWNKAYLYITWTVLRWIHSAQDLA